MSLEKDDLEGLAEEIRRVIESNRKFLERVEDDDIPEDDEVEDGGPEMPEEL